MKPTKKPMPNSCTKKQLFNMYLLDLPKREIRKNINLIIKENRKLINEKICNQNISPKELQEFIAIYGLPRNYEKEQ